VQALKKGDYESATRLFNTTGNLNLHNPLSFYTIVSYPVYLFFQFLSNNINFICNLDTLRSNRRQSSTFFVADR
jgi:hypothetical protein